MGKIVQKNLPCLSPTCGSSDARQLYEDGSSHCFSCKKTFRGAAASFVAPSKVVPEEGFKKVPYTKMPTIEEIAEFPTRGFVERKITKDICEFFGVKVSYDEDGEIDTHYYPYHDGLGFKVRKLPKTFTFIGKSPSLFGREKFAGGGKRLVIVEGEMDALSMAQAHFDQYKKIYPVIGLPSATSVNQLLEHREWIRSFQEVVLCLDNDKAGQEALEIAIKIVGFDKAKIAVLPEKDSSDVLVKLGYKILIQAVWDAAPYTPSSIIKTKNLWENLVAYNKVKAVPYPDCMEGVNEKLDGMRPGEIVLFISGTGSGKSTLSREIMIHLKRSTQAKIGIISLEESPAETARKLSGMAIDRNPANSEISIDDLKVGFDEIFGDERILMLDHQGSIRDSSIIDTLEYMALTGCEYIFVDHITMLVSEGSEGLSGNEAIDAMMNSLLRVVKKHPVWIGLVSHLRKAPTSVKSFEQGVMPTLDDIKGSGSIKQVSFDVIAFARDMTAPEETVRNTVNMSVLKARTTGRTGPAKSAYYLMDKGRLVEISKAPREEFTVL